jgi:hypothetical protein
MVTDNYFVIGFPCRTFSFSVGCLCVGKSCLISANNDIPAYELRKGRIEAVSPTHKIYSLRIIYEGKGKWKK